MRRFIQKHIYGILGTIIVHLMLAILFMLIKLSTTYQERQESIIIDFESTPEEPEIIEMEVPDRVAEMYNNEAFWTNIARNLSSQTDEEFDIDDYIDQIKKELIESGEISEENYLDELRQRLEEGSRSGETEFRDLEDSAEEITADEMATAYSGPTRIYYVLEGRTHRYLPLPIYKCEGNGKVVLGIVVDQRGFVLSAEVIQEESSTDDYCLHDMAKDAALRTRFNLDLSAPARQQGLLTYNFVAQ